MLLFLNSFKNKDSQLEMKTKIHLLIKLQKEMEIAFKYQVTQRLKRLRKNRKRILKIKLKNSYVSLQTNKTKI